MALFQLHNFRCNKNTNEFKKVLKENVWNDLLNRKVSIGKKICKGTNDVNTSNFRCLSNCVYKINLQFI